MKIVVGGPPHSGKSTFTAILRKLIREILGATSDPELFHSLTLDLVDNSTEWMDDRSGRTPRRELGGFTRERAVARREAFEQSDAALALADAPGVIDDYTRILVQPAQALIVVSKDQGGIEEWRDFAGEVGMEMYAVFETFLPREDTVPSWDPNRRVGSLRGLSREAYRANGVRGIEYETVRVLKALAYELVETALT